MRDCDLPVIVPMAAVVAPPDSYKRNISLISDSLHLNFPGLEFFAMHASAASFVLCLCPMFMHDHHEYSTNCFIKVVFTPPP